MVPFRPWQRDTQHFAWFVWDCVHAVKLWSNFFFFNLLLWIFKLTIIFFCSLVTKDDFWNQYLNAGDLIEYLRASIRKFVYWAKKNINWRPICLLGDDLLDQSVCIFFRTSSMIDLNLNEHELKIYMIRINSLLKRSKRTRSTWACRHGPCHLYQQNTLLLFGTCGLLDHLGSNTSRFKRVPKNCTSWLHSTWALFVPRVLWPGNPVLVPS